MARYLAGNSARKGVYLCTWPPDICFVSADDEPLMGRDGYSYRRLPGAVVVAISPLLGALFVIGFPFVIVAAIVYALAHPVVARLRAHAGERAYLVRGDYALAAAHLDGKKRRKSDADEKLEDDGELDDLRDAVDQERRSRERGESEEQK